METHETFTSIGLPKLHNTYSHLQRILCQTAATSPARSFKPSFPSPSYSVESSKNYKASDTILPDTILGQDSILPRKRKPKKPSQSRTTLTWDKSAASMHILKQNQQIIKHIRLNELNVFDPLVLPSRSSIQKISGSYKPPRHTLLLKAEKPLEQLQPPPTKVQMLESYLIRKGQLSLKKWPENLDTTQAIAKYVNKVNQHPVVAIEEKFIYVKSFEDYAAEQLEQKSVKEITESNHHETINLNDAHYSSTKLATTIEERNNEERRQELLKQIQHGQQQLRSQSCLMLNKNYRMLVQEGKAKQKQKKLTNYRVIRQQLITSLQFLKRLKLTPKILMTTEVFSYKPFQKEGSQALMQASKTNNHVRVQEMLKDNRFLVYDFDYIQLTALHWACKRGHLETSRLLLDAGADVDSQDLIGRTPLYFAIEANSSKVVQLLLENAASPWSTPTANYNDIGKTNRNIMKMLNKARKLHILMRMTPPAIREDIWKTQVKGSLRM